VTAPSSLPNPVGTEPRPQPSRLADRVRTASPAAQGLIALVVYLALWLITAFPLLLHAGTPQLDQSSTDPNFYVWSLRWWPYAIGHGLNPLFSSQIGAPAGYSLAWVTSIPPLALIFFPVTALAGAVVSFNVLVVAAIPVSGWAAFILCRRLTGRFWASLTGGAVYGFSAYEMNHIASGQLNLAFALLLPLIAYLIVAWRDGAIGTRTCTALLALALAAQLYLFTETFVDLSAVLVVGLAAGYALADRAGRTQMLRLSRIVGVAYVIAIILALPFLKYALANMPPGFTQRPNSASLALAMLVVPWAGHTLGLSWLAHAAVQLAGPDLDGYVGIPLLLIAITLPLVAWRRRLVRFLIVMVTVLVIAAFGPALRIDSYSPVVKLPWAALWSLPVIRSAYPVRLMVFVFLGLAVMTALWLSEPAKRRWARWLLALLAAVTVAANTPALVLHDNPGFPAFVTTGEYRQYLRPAETVVVLSERGNVGLLWQAQTDFYTRLAGGFINKAITQYGGVPKPVAELSIGGLTAIDVRNFHSYLKSADIGAILVESSEAGPWPAIFRQLGLNGKTVGGVIIYRT
jgi:hypothetical protein